MYNNLRAEMTRKGLDIRGLARRMNLAEPTLYNKFSGVSEFKLNEMEEIKAVLKIDASFDYLFKR